MKQCPKRYKHIIWKVVGNKAVLLNLHNGTYFEVDPVGLAVWHACDGKLTEEAISRKIAKRFSASVERVHKDVLGYLGQLRNNKLISDGKEKASNVERRNYLAKIPQLLKKKK